MELFTYIDRSRDGEPMAKSELKKMAAANPKVDEKKLFEVLSVLRKLRKKGLSTRGYELDIPFTRRVHIKHDDNR